MAALNAQDTYRNYGVDEGHEGKSEDEVENKVSDAEDIINDPLYKFLISNKTELNIQNDDYIIQQFYTPLKKEAVDLHFLSTNNDNDIKEVLKECGFKATHKMQLMKILKNSKEAEIYDKKDEDGHPELEQSTTETAENKTQVTDTPKLTSGGTNINMQRKYVIALLVLISAIILGILINYTPVVENSTLLHCPNIQTPQYIPLASTSISNKIISMNNNPDSTVYKWKWNQFDFNECDVKVKGQNTNGLEISNFNKCSPFHLRVMSSMHFIKNYYIYHSTHSKECIIDFIFHPMLECPHAGNNNTLYISSMTTTKTETKTKTISVAYVKNTEYEWMFDDTVKDEECAYDFQNENTNNLKLKFEACRKLQNIKLLMNSTISKRNNFYYDKQCELNLYFYDEPIMGVDLGTTYSCISYQKNKANTAGRRETNLIVVDKISTRYCMPSAVYFGENKEILIGKPAMEKLKDDPKNVIYDIKRIIGRSSNDIAFMLFKDNHMFNVSNDNKKVIIPNWNEALLFEQILSIILTYLVEIGSNDWGSNNEIPMYSPNIVVSVPALFHNGQRKGVRSSCHLSGLNPMKLLVEPSAASLAYSYYNTKPDLSKKLQLFLAFDFGGGTLDCSVMRCTGVECAVLSVHGHSALGGRDFDNIIRDIIIDKYEKQYGWNISKTNNINLYSQILDKSEEIKIDLSLSTEYTLFLINPQNGEQKSILITREEFENHKKTKQLINSVLNVVNTSVIGSGSQWTSVRMILMIGGTSHIPIVKRSLTNTFGVELVFSNDIDPEYLVTYGCGITGGSLYNQYNNYQQITAKDVVLDDVIPQSIGLETCVWDLNSDTLKECGRMEKVLLKNQRYPTFETIERCQEPPDAKVFILSIYEGDNIYTKDNYFLGNITIKDIEARDSETCDNILIKFIVDDNGIFKVEAETNKKYNDGKVRKYDIEVASENAKHGTITKEKTIQLAQNMVSWYNVHLFPLFTKYLNDYPELNKLFSDEK